METVNIELPVYRTPEGKHTCAANFDTAEVCQFYRVKYDSAFDNGKFESCSFTWTKLENDTETAFLVPCDKCPIEVMLKLTRKADSCESATRYDKTHIFESERIIKSMADKEITNFERLVDALPLDVLKKCLEDDLFVLNKKAIKSFATEDYVFVRPVYNKLKRAAKKLGV